MTLAVWQATIADNAGNAQGGASVEVRLEEAGSPLANIFTDREGQTGAANPIAADASGFVRFYAAGGAYKITATKGSFSRVWRHVGIGLAGELDGAPAGVTWRFASETADADPGAGNFRLDNADPASATKIFIDPTDSDGLAQGDWIESFDDSGIAAKRGVIVLRATNNAALVVAQVTGSIVVNGSPPGYYEIPISVLSASEAGDFVAGERFGFLFASAGAAVALDLGDDGSIQTTALEEIATSGDTNNIFTHPISGKLLIDLSKRWPAADSAAALSSTLGISSGGTGQTSASAAFGALKQAASRTATGVVEEATAAEVYASTDGKFIDAGHLASAAAPPSALSDATTIALNWAAFTYDRITIAGNRTLGTWTNEQPGQWREFEVVGNNATARSLSFGSEYEVAPTLDDITSTKSYLVSIKCMAAGRFRAYADEGGDPT